MEKEATIGHKNGTRSFSDTRDFVSACYEGAFEGEIEVPADDIEGQPSYTRIGDKYFLPNFTSSALNRGREYLLISMPIDAPSSVASNIASRRANSTLLYIFSEEKDIDEKYATYKEIGGIYKALRETIRQDISLSLEELHVNADQSIQEEYPLSSLVRGKPQGLSTRVKRSLSSGGVSSLEIGQMLGEGYTTRDLNEKYGATKVSGARKTLNSWGIDSPEKIERRDLSEAIEKISSGSASIEELCNLILEFNTRHLVKKYTKGHERILASIRTIQGEAWGNENPRFTKVAYEILKDNGFPVNEVPNVYEKDGVAVVGGYYRFSFDCVAQSAVDLLSERKEFVYSPVTQVAGDEDPNVPNTTELFRNRGKFARLSAREAKIVLEEGSIFRIFRYQPKSKSAKDTSYHMRLKDTDQDR